eukprot:TRINITY_DN13939_c0_g1_i1.p1 TRINITY_DN13939_c0_g1~~TRINITY_DN13939_c0_g1_i1.p1  ORF type:complete len:312 (+),score=48.67 TRINITY_DN13939_c0_g1_i1:73-1008(+)
MSWRDEQVAQPAPPKAAPSPPAPPRPDSGDPLIGRRLCGVVKSWNDQKGYGFVTWTDDGGAARDFYCHTKAIGRLKLVSGKDLEFYVDKRPHAPDSSQLQVCEPVTGPGVERPACHMFLLGKCVYGDECRFPHVQKQGGGGGWKGGAGTGGGDGGSGGSQHRNYKTAMCKRYEQGGSCFKGEDCPFAHSDAELRPRQQGGKGSPGRDGPFGRRGYTSNQHGTLPGFGPRKVAGEAMSSMNWRTGPDTAPAAPSPSRVPAAQTAPAPAPSPGREGEGEDDWEAGPARDPQHEDRGDWGSAAGFTSLAWKKKG